MALGLRPAAVLGLAGLLAAGAGTLGVTGANSGPSGAGAFAAAVLAEATVPPGGRPTHGVHTLEARWLGGWGATPGTGGVVGAHAFYLYKEPAAAVLRDVRAQVPPGAVVTGVGTVNGLVLSVTETVAVSGPNEYSAELTYQAAATDGAGTTSELRIDAKTVWEPPRPATERAPFSSVVEITGYATSTPSGGARRPVTATVSGPRARRFLAAFDSLALGPTSPGCHEDARYFTALLRAPGARGSTFRVVEDACVDYVGVTQAGRLRPALSDRHCALIDAAAQLLPRRARATRRAARTCLRRRVRARGLGSL